MQRHLGPCSAPDGPGHSHKLGDWYCAERTLERCLRVGCQCLRHKHYEYNSPGPSDNPGDHAKPKCRLKHRSKQSCSWDYGHHIGLLLRELCRLDWNFGGSVATKLHWLLRTQVQKRGDKYDPLGVRSNGNRCKCHPATNCWILLQSYTKRFNNSSTNSMINNMS